MKLRIAAVTIALTMVVGLVTGCVPEPAASPSPTGFATEEEAFAAAEATYRAYVDALNARREDPASQPDPQTFLIGAALEDDVAAQTQLDQAGLILVGPSEVTPIARIVANVREGTVTASFCLNSSMTSVLDSTGADVTPSSRQTRTPLRVDFVFVAESLLIESSTTNGEGQC